MSKKHNTKHHQRGQSKYPQRLKGRGVSSASVRMENLETLQRRQTMYAPQNDEALVSQLRTIRKAWRGDDE